jgi:hypothetical protein
MYTLKIEHAIRDYDTWKAAFDRDPAGRERNGVRSYRVSRPVNDPHYIVIDLDFDRPDQAQAFLVGLQQVWARADQSPGLAREGAAPPRTAIVQLIEQRT